MKMRSLLLVLSLVALVGCGAKGPALAPLQGLITDDGTPIAGMNVTFSPQQDGAASWGITDAEGKFTLHYIDGREGVLPGEHLVSISGGDSLAGDGQSTRAPRRVKRPREYRRTMEVAVDQDFVEIDLSAKK
ncbi:carboxypeptidase-like regulatory domain-containing protein [Blastopirellula sp. J2-11]|uniref:carboxypeptidase-like regulatory domain-containing protein n=1 Tax=Blastopirellula sp. J2-11 TaxID=2943192 RepID=UPI0021C5DC1B|nr:carboxypeptidase-like regulatory domain-containing protein [Blastopirellula sp. J2-11]UUO05371.1 carboxypeptidase-like regulatory domain-containing protein [Blastopirellula sp. J2-11]